MKLILFLTLLWSKEQNELTEVYLLTAISYFFFLNYTCLKDPSQRKDDIESHNLRWLVGQLEDIKIEMYTDVPSTDSRQH